MPVPTGAAGTPTASAPEVPAVTNAPTRARRPRGGSSPPRAPPEPILPIPGLYDYALLGNLQTAALVSRFGGVEWLCLPRFASPSVFGRILDRRAGGTFEITPADPFESEQTYLPSSNIVLTRFFLPGDRQLDLLDFMPVGAKEAAEPRPLLVRIGEARGGAVRVRVRVLPRFQYGAESPTWTGSGAFHQGTGSADRLWLWSSPTLPPSGDGIRTELELADGARLSFVLGSDAPPADAPNPDRLLRSSTHFWQSWVHPASTPIHRIAGLWHSWVERSELVLKLLSVEGSGAFIAAPTTSLPEWPGGTRNWDYRFVWIRDAAFSAQALLLLGHFDEAERFLEWVIDRFSADASSGPLQVMYSTEDPGGLQERELGHLEGFQGSRPVRVGNAAESQFQLDIYGELLDAARLLAVRNSAKVRPYWPRLARLADYVAARWQVPDHGIWEFRTAPKLYVHSRLMAWVALDRSVDLARRFGDESSATRWEPIRESVRDWLLRDGYDAASRSFVQAAGEREIDAANLRIPIVGFLPYTDARVRGTVARVRKELAVGPFVYRYRNPDGIEGPEGTFLPAAFWLVECLARMGERRQAVAHFRRLLLAASPLGLYPEEYDPLRRRPLGNYPQALTHIGLLRAAVALGATEMPSFIVPRSDPSSSA